MASKWSAENATKAYLRALKMGKTGKEPDVSEFISALAAGNSAQLMVTTSAGIAAGATTLSLVAAARQTGGRVICILPEVDNLQGSKEGLGVYGECVEFIIGDAKTLMSNEYKGADFVLIDCSMSDGNGVFRAAKESLRVGGGIIVGYNAFNIKGSSWCSFRTHFLPIGEGLMVTRMGEIGCGRRSKWVVKVDGFTGEEHVFRITSEQRLNI